MTAEQPQSQTKIDSPYTLHDPLKSLRQELATPRINTLDPLQVAKVVNIGTNDSSFSLDAQEVHRQHLSEILFTEVDFAIGKKAQKIFQERKEALELQVHDLTKNNDGIESNKARFYEIQADLSDLKYNSKIDASRELSEATENQDVLQLILDEIVDKLEPNEKISTKDGEEGLLSSLHQVGRQVIIDEVKRNAVAEAIDIANSYLAIIRSKARVTEIFTEQEKIKTLNEYRDNIPYFSEEEKAELALLSKTVSSEIKEGSKHFWQVCANYRLKHKCSPLTKKMFPNETTKAAFTAATKAVEKALNLPPMLVFEDTDMSTEEKFQRLRSQDYHSRSYYLDTMWKD